MDFYIPEPQAPSPVVRAVQGAADRHIGTWLGAARARQRFQVDGSGLTAAVLDTGLRVTHRCFAGRVAAVRNFTAADEAQPELVTDTNGHGTHVAGLIAAGTPDERRGIAPGARIAALKVLPASTLAPVLAALDWVAAQAEALDISVVTLAQAVPGINETDDLTARQLQPELYRRLAALHRRHIAVVAAAGNSYGDFQSEGMSLPAIFREVIAVGAVYEASMGPRRYAGGVEALATQADQITPYTQRLSQQTSPDCHTDVFSAGGAATSAGAFGDDDSSVQDGSSQAAPAVAGVVLLMQQHHRRLRGTLPPIELLQAVLGSTSTVLHDGDNGCDNVAHTGRRYPRIDACAALVALDRALQRGAA